MNLRQMSSLSQPFSFIGVPLPVNQTSICLPSFPCSLKHNQSNSKQANFTIFHSVTLCVCVFVSVCLIERAIKKERERERECVCLCVCIVLSNFLTGLPVNDSKNVQTEISSEAELEIPPPRVNFTNFLDLKNVDSFSIEKTVQFFGIKYGSLKLRPSGTVETI